MTRRRFHRIIGPVFFIMGSIWFDRALIGEDMTPPECGENSLYTFLRLHGRYISLGELQKHFPPRVPEGYSFEDLRTVSESIGFTLEGIAIRSPKEMPREPFIAALSHGKVGHFIVLRPIEGSPSLVQVFDPPDVPIIVNSDVLMSHQHWTGKLLVKKRLYRTWHLAFGIVLVFFCLLHFVIARTLA